MEQTNGFVDFVMRVLNYNLFPLGEARVTLLSFIYIIVFSALLFWASRRLKDLILNRVLPKTNLDVSAQQAIGTIFRYVVLFLGFLVILQTVGINLTTLNVLAGAVGIGVGFGLQNIASNFISGLIILMERPVKVGDRIEVGKVTGKVVSIGARSTVVKTNDNITIVVPNSKFISENVINWSYDSRQPRVRFHVPISLPYQADIKLVEKLMLEVVTENGDVLDDPPPSVRLKNFNDGSLQLELWVWSRAKLHRRGVLISDLNFAMLDKFRKNGVEIAAQSINLTTENMRTKDADSLAPDKETAGVEKVN